MKVLAHDVTSNAGRLLKVNVSYQHAIELLELPHDPRW